MEQIGIVYLTLFIVLHLQVLSKPTTLAGFGITDAFSGNFADLTNKPTTSRDMALLIPLRVLLLHCKTNTLSVRVLVLLAALHHLLETYYSSRIWYH